jgi:hypothetical protein
MRIDPELKPQVTDGVHQLLGKMCQLLWLIAEMLAVQQGKD